MEIREHFTSTDVIKLFRIDDRFKSRVTFLNAEASGAIPKADRINRGKVSVRQWTINQLPEIGKKFGFLTHPSESHAICVHTGKGGVLKSTLTSVLARSLALCGIRTLIVGLDIQISVTNYVLPRKQIQSLDEYSPGEQHGLYDLLFENVALEQVVKKTDLPTLDIIPETAALGYLEKKIRLQPRAQYIFVDKLMPLLKDYDVVLFDNSPNWNSLVECALVASNHLVSPVACELGCYEALKPNLENVREFAETMKISFDSVSLIPTLREKHKLSEQIYGAYISQYPDRALTASIRRAVAGQESLWKRQTVFEVEPTSALADDYYEVIQSLWERVLSTEAQHGV